MATIQASMQLIDRVSKPLQNINAVLQKTINLFGNAQNAVSAFENQLANLTDIKISPIKITTLIEDTRMSVSIEPIIDIQDTLPPIGLPVFPTIPDTLPPIELPVTPSIPDTLPPIKQPVIPTWQSDNSIQIFDTSGVERYKQEVSSAQSMMERLSSIQANIAIKANDTKLFPPNMSADMESSYQRIIKISKAMSSLSNQKIDSAGANKLNNSIESVRANINQAITAQNALNNAMKSMDISSANSAYQKLVSNISIAETSIRDNISKQSEFNRKIQQGGTEASNLANKIKGCVRAYLSIAGLKTGIENTVGAAMTLDQQQTAMNAMFGNASIGNAYFKQLQQYALDTGQNINDLSVATKRFMGVTKNTDKLMEFNKIAQKMAIYDPEQGVQGAAYALNEAMSGSYTSLKQRFELSNADIDPLKEAVKQGNIDGIQQALNNIMVGKNITDEVLAAYQDNPAFKFNTMIEAVKSKLAEAGKASLEVVEPMIEKITTFLNSDTGSAIFNGISNAAYTIMSVLNIVASTVMTIVGIFLNSDIGSAIFNGMSNVASALINVLSTAASIIITISSIFVDNWGWIEPIIWGVVAAVAAYNAIQLISNSTQLIYNGIIAIATLLQWAFSAALWACPLTWIVVAIGLIIAGIVVLIKNVGGLEVAFMMLKNWALTVWDNICIWCSRMVMNVLNGWDNLCVGIKTICVGIQNVLGDMKTGGLIILQGFVNGAIDIINTLISTVNKIPGISIDTINTVHFATDAQIKNNAEKKARNADLAKYKAQKDEAKKTRQDDLNKQIETAKRNATERQAEIDAVKIAKEADNAKEKASKEDNTASQAEIDDWNSKQSDTLNSISDDTKGIKDSVDISEEDLKYLRDIAEMEVVNSFTTAEIKVSMSNNNTINSALDLDGITSTLTDVIYEQMQVAAEGVYN